MSDLLSEKRVMSKIPAPYDLEGGFGYNIKGSLPVDQADFNI